ncbi:DUF1918 domain-containing protein [Phytoactinopolyspora limicola]|uniref:DUF1918 domain-containing protein n=1 Tax=Phytoactinopolyspora limicola TaxID=2715536 RepID=UPI00140777FB|nr:DUF1918 domain-containing protein [Phytoactinopolyspora limicola]
MQANIGDHIVVGAGQQGQRGREGEVVEVQGRGGTPPYIVRWIDTGKLALYFPGRDAHVQHPQGNRY